MKNKWIMLPVVLLAVFGLLVGCDNGGGGKKPEPGKTPTKEWVISGANIALTTIGNGSGQETDGNKYSLKSAAATSSGFSWTIPEESPDGFKSVDYDKVTITIKILAQNNAAADGLCFMARDASNMTTNVPTIAGDEHGQLYLLGGKDFEGEQEYSAKGFKNGVIVFQYNPWADKLAQVPRENPDFQIEVVNITFMPKGGAAGGADSADFKQKVTLEDNYFYGLGYQSDKDVTTLRWDKLLNTDLKPGDQYKIDFEFTVSRDLEEDLQVCLAWQPSAEPYWGMVAEWQNVGPGTTEPPIDDKDPPDGKYTPPAGSVGYTTAGGPYERSVTLTIRPGTRGGRTPQIADITKVPKSVTWLTFSSKGEGTKGEGVGFGVKGPVEVDFTKLTITKL